jgi:hypothetical protein
LFGTQVEAVVPFRANIINHIQRINHCLPRFDGQAELDFKTLRLKISARNKYFELIPQYFYRLDGRMVYTPNVPANFFGFLGFLGWLPYFNKRWELATDKLAFKQHCVRHAIRTPQYWAGTKDLSGGVLIKERLSSFGQGIRGPFGSLSADGVSGFDPSKSFYEKFIPGKPAKAWYWEDKLFCLEIMTMPTVTGDGRQTIRQLIDDSVPGVEFVPDWQAATDLVRYQGHSLDNVLAEGKVVEVDFKYGSRLLPRAWKDSNVVREHQDTAIGRQFAQTGRLLWQAIPEEIRPMTLSTVDAVIDGQDQVWFLEMNSNPMLHPDIYPLMFESFFGPAAEPASEHGTGEASSHPPISDPAYPFGQSTRS